MRFNLKKKIDALPKWVKNKYALVLMYFVFHLFFIDDITILNLIQLKQEKRQIERNNLNKKRDINTLKQKIHILEYDTVALVKFAREYYKMKKKDEVIYLFIPKDSVKNKRN